MTDRYRLAQRLVKEAGRVALTYFGKDWLQEIPKKGGRNDFYMIADIEAEGVILRGIRREFPQDGYICEESGDTEGSSGYDWIVDPVDGTIPFCAKSSSWGVSVGYRWEGKTCGAVIHLPVERLTVGAKRDQPVVERSGVVKPLNKLLVGVEYSKERDMAEVARTTGLLIEHVRYVVTRGSCAYAIAMLALGRLDAVVLRPDRFDLAGIDLIVEKYGGKIGPLGGETLDRDNLGFILAVGQIGLWQQLAEILDFK